MKRILLFATATAAFLITACGDNKTPNPNTKSETPVSEVQESQIPTDSSIIYSSEKASLIVDESQRTLIISFNSQPIDRCVTDGNNAIWKSIPSPAETDTVKYSFLGDTLILDDFLGDGLRNGNMYTGGTTGSIYGTWKRIPCYWPSQDSTTSCNKQHPDYEELSINFSKDTMTISSKYDWGREENDITKKLKENGLNMHSSFMTAVYETLLGKQTDFYFEHDDMFFAINRLTDSTHFSEENKIQITESTKTSGAFSFNGKHYTVKINKAEFSLLDDKEEIDIEVSDGVNICRVQYLEMQPQKEQCKSENINGFQTVAAVDKDGYRDVVYYKKTNEKEFFKCINGIAPITNK